jgi:predicted PolB exonuclease-like 3'-5' exonuclease
VKTVVFDIETVSRPWLELDSLQRERLTRYSEDHEDFLRRKEGGALSPYTGKVIVIAMLNPESGQGKVWYEAAERREEKSEDGFFEYVGCGEKEMLVEFWAALSKFERFVSFNGRAFDGPFLSVRSAVHALLPSKNLSGYRYSIESHVDLLEVLTFHGTVSRDQSPSLHSACLAFDIPSPKSEEMHGYAVGDAYREGRLGDVAEYCRRDVEATAALFRRLETTLLPLFRK